MSRFLRLKLLSFVAASIAAAGMVSANEIVTRDASFLLTNETEVMRGLSAVRTASLTERAVPLPKLRPRNLQLVRIPSKKDLLRMPKASGGSEWACLTEALYFEARGESVRGIFAVAEVIVNRKNSRRFPNSICGVITQGSHRLNACQFSYKCDGLAENYNEPKAYAMVGKIARLVLDDKVHKMTRGALFYHSRTVNPYWSRAFDRTAEIGKHLFYRPG